MRRPTARSNRSRRRRGPARTRARPGPAKAPRRSKKADRAGAKALAARLRGAESRLEALRDVATAIVSSLDLDSLLKAILDRITRVMEADRSTLYLLDADRGEVWSKVIQPDGVRKIRVRLGEGIAGWVAQSGEAVNLADAHRDARFDPTWDRLTGYRTKTVLAVPMTLPGGRTIGVVQVLNRRAGRFTAEDEGFLRALASQAAVSIENSRLFQSVLEKNRALEDLRAQLEKKVRELDLLAEFERMVSRSVDPDALLYGVIDKAIALSGAEAGSILLLEEETGALTFRSAVGDCGDEILRLRVPAGRGICGWVASRGEPLIVNDVDGDPRHSREIADRIGHQPRSILCVPLATERGTIGAMELLDKRGPDGPSPFDADDLQVAMMIAGHAGPAIELALARKQRADNERLAVIGQLLSGVIHDLKTPMSIASGYVEMMLSAPDDADRRRFGEVVLRQFEHMNQMTREILAFARGERTLLVRKVYVNRFLDDVIEQIAREVVEHGVEVTTDVQYKGVAFFDEVKVRRAFLNLARNALEAMRARGHGRLSIGSYEREGMLVFEIGDDGPGIPAEIRSRLFHLFVTYGKREGTGLGLAIVKRIVDEHGGRIDVETSERGTTFRMELPMRSEAADASAGPAAAPSTTS